VPRAQTNTTLKGSQRIRWKRRESSLQPIQFMDLSRRDPPEVLRMEDWTSSSARKMTANDSNPNIRPQSRLATAIDPSDCALC